MTKNKFAAKRLDNIPPYLFAEIDKKRLAAIAKGVDIINLGIGDPDQPTPDFIVQSMHDAINDPATHNYPPYAGTPEYRQAAVDWFAKRFNLPAFNRDTECLALIGMKEALHNLFLAVVNEGDTVLIPAPGYPVYKTSSILVGANYHVMPLVEGNDYMIDLDAIPDEVAAKASLMILNYPNNPTGAFADKEFFEKIIAFAKKHNILVCHDHAYSEIYFDLKNPPISIFNVEGAYDIAIEMFSLSKGYNMTGWRAGFAVGNADAIGALSTVKTNIDSGIFKAIQRAGITALTADQSKMDYMRELYASRAKVAEAGLAALGWDIKPSEGTLYIWARIPRRFSSSIEFANAMLDECGIVVPPGIGYGDVGEGYFRIALSATEERLKEAFERMEKANMKY